ncbi:ankryin [Myxococcus sp. K38C18041901]|uniref:ankyrin repeat domain-containing protein n=1 Tax=Myxococcus guangdongensis TaxID=2906760 RepID=UPI0020A6F376|nr:ankyrin repeat domain-containing protein [Myxococcus guangdongensis]MCP3064044.1 ankryin [Myxococcus guangdongensis]
MSNRDATQALLSLCESKTRWRDELTAEAVRKAVADGADVNARNRDGMTPLHLVVQQPYSKIAPLPGVDVARVLIEAGADVNARDHHQQTPLLRAIPHDPAMEERALELIRLLRAAGGRVPSDVKDRNAGAFSLSTPALYREVLDAGASLDVRDDEAQTPLHWALRAVEPELVKLMLERGADVNALDGMGRTPLGVALHTWDEVWAPHGQRARAYVSAVGAVEAAGGKPRIAFPHDPSDPFAPLPIDADALKKTLAGKTLPFKHAVASAQEVAAGLHGSGDPATALARLDALRAALSVEARRLQLKGPLTLKRTFFHHGDLEVDGDLSIQRPFAVTGNVIVNGVVRDSGHDSLVNILGDLRCHGLCSDGELNVRGVIEARDVVLGHHNDYLLSAATFRARVVIEDDHAFDGTVEATHHFDINTYGDDVADALRAIFVDEVFPEATPRIDREVLFDRISQGLPVFREPTEAALTSVGGASLSRRLQ